MQREITFVAKARCLHCNATEISRGLCQNHYNVCRAKVKAGEATWEQFERAGISRKRQRSAGEDFMKVIGQSS